MRKITTHYWNRFELQDGVHICDLYILEYCIATGKANVKQLAKRKAAIAGLEWLKSSTDDVLELLKKSLDRKSTEGVID